MMNSGLRRLLSGAVALMLLGCSSALADTATVTARKLILREKASSTSDALQTLPKGTKLEVLGKSGSWYKVTYGKYTGYVYTILRNFSHGTLPQEEFAARLARHPQLPPVGHCLATRHRSQVSGGFRPASRRPIHAG